MTGDGDAKEVTSSCETDWGTSIDPGSQVLDQELGEFFTASPTTNSAYPDDDQSPLAAAASYMGALFDLAMEGARAGARAVCGGWESSNKEGIERDRGGVPDVIDAGLSGIVRCVFHDAACAEEDAPHEIPDTREDRCRRYGELASKIPVRDLADEERVNQDSLGQLEVDLAVQSSQDTADMAVATKILIETVELYPNVGYIHVSL